MVRIERTAEPGTTVTVETPTETVTTEQTVSVLTEEAFFDRVRKYGEDGERNVVVARRFLELLKDTDLLITWNRASFSIKFLDPSETSAPFSLAYVYEQGNLSCWASNFARRIQRVFGDGESASQIVDGHISQLKAFGATGEKDMGVMLSSLDGREKEIIDWLKSTAKAITEEADKLPQQE